MGQIPFTSLNFGTCTSTEGRLVIEKLLLAIESGLGNHETAIFPISIFKAKKGINRNPEDPNHDLYELAIRVLSKRLFPNFTNLDAPFNAKYYEEGNPDTEMATMGCRTRTIGDRHGWKGLSGKGNLSFVTVNLVRLAIIHKDDKCLEGFKKDLYKYMKLSLRCLLDRFEWQKQQIAKASDFMMREGVWRNGETLAPNDKVGELLKHGSMSIGFIGLAECLKMLTGKHHGESEESYKLGLEIIKYMRKFTDDASEEYDLNITLFATPAEGLSGKFTKKDKKEFGVIPEVTDREYYTNSFHIPVYYNITAKRKLDLEAPFHELCNGGAISYIELDGNVRENPKAVQTIIDYALEKNISYVSVNFSLDRCPACKYEGVIGSVCPNCGRTNQEIRFVRIRRATGYLNGDYEERFNPYKQAEVRDRVKHMKVN